MKFTTSHLLFVIVIALLCAMGVAFLYSTGYLGAEFAVRSNYLRQCAFILVGTVLAVGVCALAPGGSAWRWGVFGGYAASLLLLVLVLFVGKSIGGARRWLAIGSLLLQPAEFARVFTLLAGALLLDGRTLPRRWELPAALACFLAPMLLILLEPSYGNAASLAVPAAVMIGIRYFPRWLWLSALVTAVVLVALLAVGVWQIRSQDAGDSAESVSTAVSGETGKSGILRGYHLKRLRTFLSSEGGWNEQQSLMAVSGGGLTGKGYLNGTMKNLGFLPRTVAPTDFIFAVVAEEGGLLFGVLPLLLLYWFLFSLLLHWAARAQNRLCLNLLTGGTALLLVHVVVGVGMAVRLVPIIGLPLPLLSYGGSFTLAVFLLLGALAAADRHREEKDAEDRTNDAAKAPMILRLGRVLKFVVRS